MMEKPNGQVGEDRVSAFVDTPESETRTMTAAERAGVVAAGAEFAKHAPGIWLLISGRFTSSGDDNGTEDQVRDMLRRAFDDPKSDDRTIKVLLDSSGGSLDCAYATVLYLSAYANTLEVYVPDAAKSASTLLGVGADTVYLSAFGELGPLDSQIRDPRNPVKWVSALDCYQSVDYVRDFALRTVREVLDRLVVATDKRVGINGLVDTASSFSLGIIEPMMRSVEALDFGGWGRSLRISEHYARKLFEAKDPDADHAKAARIAFELVYGYPHHLFPIDYREAERIGLRVAKMEEDLYDEAIKVIRACHKKDFVGFISQEEYDRVAQSGTEDKPTGAGCPDFEEHRGEVDRTGGL